MSLACACRDARRTVLAKTVAQMAVATLAGPVVLVTSVTLRWGSVSQVAHPVACSRTAELMAVADRAASACPTRSACLVCVCPTPPPAPRTALEKIAVMTDAAAPAGPVRSDNRATSRGNVRGPPAPPTARVRTAGAMAVEVPVAPVRQGSTVTRECAHRTERRAPRPVLARTVAMTAVAGRVDIVAPNTSVARTSPACHATRSVTDGSVVTTVVAMSVGTAILAPSVPSMASVLKRGVRPTAPAISVETTAAVVSAECVPVIRSASTAVVLGTNHRPVMTAARAPWETRGHGRTPAQTDRFFCTESA